MGTTPIYAPLCTVCEQHQLNTGRHDDGLLISGLSTEQYKANLARFGPNALTPPPSLPWWVKFLMQFANFFAVLLLAGGALCFIGYGIDPDKDPTNLYLGVVLFAVVMITATFSYLQEAKSEAIMEGFKKLIPKQTHVTRNGTVSVVDAAELVPGDIVTLNDGDQIPADILLVKANEFKVLIRCHMHKSLLKLYIFRLQFKCAINTYCQCPRCTSLLTNGNG
eukprot:1190680-Prorocentrum_minimum.AAC.5